MSDLATTIDISVRSTYMDAYRVVNNAIYFMYFEQSRLAHFRRLQLFQQSPWESGGPRPFAIVATESRFLAPVTFPETLRVTTWTREVRTRSFVLAYRAVRASDGTSVAEGSSVQVWVDADGRSTPLPDRIRQILRATVPPAEESEGISAPDEPVQKT